jgi:hypothetical protein
VDRTRDAWELHLAGVPIEQIADATGLTVTEVGDVVSRRAPTARGGEGPEVELARVNKLWRTVWPQALQSGDAKSYQVLLRLLARRLELHQQLSRVTLTEAETPSVMDTDDERAVLTALRRVLVTTLERTRSPRDIAALAGRLQDVTERLGELDARQGPETTPLDELRERRRRRRPIRDGVQRDA